MSINNVNSGGSKTIIDNQKLSQQQTASNNATQAETQKATTSTARQDSVSLTQSAQQLVQVQRKGSEAPVNQEKIDKLKKAIQSGQYNINPESLARKISNLEAEIFGNKA
ncbi:flagellar biosynthesis anti-sigma factor FlgM [Paraglaciecola hydrolytica]|uniref:Negative regulator of flagellin synthesis n=1 Tax=Paraglaciecola hydrolytica TaxID=1799789 RepID=A0A148KNJ7_9ALTE|nr:flagellar biosynthesis anti-sigma factor FlgM [Paraglaciecola hydrolytica]KXI27882.1 flagellar biosynthesis anti-sigma factor FlgM [Paraglaciecola hydrolytica]